MSGPDVHTIDRTVVPSSKAMPRQISDLVWTDYSNTKSFFCHREQYEKEIGGNGSFVAFVKLQKLESVLREVKYFEISSGIEPLLDSAFKSRARQGRFLHVLSSMH
jgi:hypothetical protein